MKKSTYIDKVSGETLYVFNLTNGLSLTKAYFKDIGRTKCHRVDGPAVEGSNGSYAWYRNGVIHNMNEPATFNAYDNTYRYYVNGVLIDLESLREAAEEL